MRNLQEDVKINKNDLIGECEEHPTIYWYWSEKAVEAKNKTKLLKNKLESFMSDVRLIVKSENAIIPEDVRDKYNKLKKDEVHYELALKRAEALAYNKVKDLTVITPLRKEKDPTAKDIDRAITLDDDFQEYENMLANTKHEIRKIENSIGSTKEATSKDIDALVLSNKEVRAMKDELLKAEQEEIRYNSALEILDNRRKMLDNITKLFLKDYFAQPKIRVPEGEHPSLTKVRPTFNKNN